MVNIKSLSKKITLFILLSISFILTSSCVYYNTFYNAEKYFESAQRHAIPETGRPAARAVQDYDKVIERCIYILREHPNSRWADNALYLLARSTYYLGRNLTQAENYFSQLISIFPESPFVPESLIYIANIYYRLDDLEKAIEILDEIMVNDSFNSRLYPRILLMKSEWYLAEDKILEGQIELQKLIDNYPRSDEYEEAFLNLGQTYLNSEEYELSRSLFESVLNSRVSRSIIFDARYYIALNDFYLGNYDHVLDLTRNLINDEYRTDKIQRIYILQARTYVALSEYKKAETLFKSLIEVNRRSAVAAEASFYLANMYFFQLNDLDNATTYFNAVSRESRTSPYVDRATAKSNLVNQLIQLGEADITVNPYEVIQGIFTVAEQYLSVLNIPDSALAMYEKIPLQEDKISKRHHVIKQFILQTEEKFNDIDTLVVRSGDIKEFKYFETIKELNGIVHFANESEDDTVYVYLNNLKQIDQQFSETINKLRNEYIPYSKFLSSWIWMNELGNKEHASRIYDILNEKYPDNRYTHATRRFLAGETVTLVHPIEEKIESQYKSAIETYEDSIIEGIESLRQVLDNIKYELDKRSSYALPLLENLYSKTLFTLGYYYYFDLDDSTNAKTYFDKLLDRDPHSEYSDFVTNFYRDNNFIVHHSLTDKPEEEDNGDTSDGEYLDEDELPNNDSSSNDDMNYYDLDYTPLPEY